MPSRLQLPDPTLADVDTDVVETLDDRVSDLERSIQCS